MIPLFLLLACAPADDCLVESTVTGFTPDCTSAVLARYSNESRLVLPGHGGGAMVAYLPAELEETVYGGTSGNAAIIELDLADGSGNETPLAATARSSTVTIGALSEKAATMQIQVDFETGTVTGALDLDVDVL